MKTTRRGFLATIGLGAAAAALAPVKGLEAARPAPDHAFVWDCAQYGQPEPFWRCGNCWRPDHEHAVVTNPGDGAYEQGKADGYNQGRLIEEARQESRQEGLPFVCHTCTASFDDEDVLDDHWYHDHFQPGSNTVCAEDCDRDVITVTTGHQITSPVQWVPAGTVQRGEDDVAPILSSALRSTTYEWGFTVDGG